MAFLAFELFEQIESNGWEIKFVDGLSMSMLFPAKAVIVDPTTKHFVNWRHRNSSLKYSVGIHDRETAQNLHNYTERQHQASGSPYIVRKTDFAVTSSVKRDGSILYTRSNFLNGDWSTVLLSADRRDRHVLGAVSSSISAGYSPPITITENGRLEAAVVQLVALFQDFEDSKESEEEDSVGANAGQRERQLGASGSGFFVTDEGHVLTNEHVISECEKIVVNGEDAVVIEASADFDLAVLKSAYGPDNTVAVFATRPAKLNSDITVIGYPYAGFLSGLNVTRGSVSSLKGIGGDLTRMQISAPVQAGNSGGPVLAATGEVVGVVVSKLDAKLVSDAIGDVPQNVNFAIRGEIAKLFLSQNGIEPTLGNSTEVLPPEQLAKRANQFTAFIECQ